MRKKKQILIADGEPAVRESFCIVLKDSYEVLTADCGKKCLKIVSEERPALVILDGSLPDMDGLEVLREVKRAYASLPVIMITAAGTHRTAIEALKLGVDDFIAKPLNFYYMRSTIARSLSRRDRNKTAGGLPSNEDIITKNYISTLKMLNKILEARDSYTREHSKDVSKYAVKLAKELGLSADEQEVIKQSALLHDIGKVAITEVILNKPNRLNTQEWTEIKRHAQIGEQFLEPLQVLHIEQSTVRHHHERYDGKGYPDHLKGEEIPLYARILSIADAYAAMTAERAYRSALSSVEALTELEKCRGTQFDPKLVAVFVRMFKKDKSLLRKEDKKR